MLLILQILPIITIMGLILCNKSEEVFLICIGFSLITLMHVLLIVHQFSGEISIFEFNFNGKLGLDGVSIWLISMISILMPIILLSTWKSINGTTYRIYIIMLLVIIFWSYAVFLVLDLLLFYISFEGVLIPMYFLIGFYGGRNRKIHAANLFFMYTLMGSLFLLLALIILYLETGTSDYQMILTIPISISRQSILWLAFFFALAIKIPMIPMHIWLPEAHVEAPTAASVLLAAILLKLGSYGLLRYCLPIFPIATSIFTPLIITICIIGIIYSSFACLALLDMKKLIAYSSIGHMNIATLAIFTHDLNGIIGSIYFLISHGIISSALFLLIGILYDRYHTRTIKYYRGLFLIMPLYSIFFLLFILANIAVPGTSGFVCEFLTFLAAFNLNPFIGILSSIAIVIAPAYSLWFFHKIIYGRLSPHLISLWSDITYKEFTMLFPLALYTLFLGFFPNVLILPIQTSCFTLLIFFPVISNRLSLKGDKNPFKKKLNLKNIIQKMIIQIKRIVSNILKRIRIFHITLIYLSYLTVQNLQVLSQLILLIFNLLNYLLLIFYSIYIPADALMGGDPNLESFTSISNNSINDFISYFDADRYSYNEKGIKFSASFGIGEVVTDSQNHNTNPSGAGSLNHTVSADVIANNNGIDPAERFWANSNPGHRVLLQGDDLSMRGTLNQMGIVYRDERPTLVYAPDWTHINIDRPQEVTEDVRVEIERERAGRAEYNNLIKYGKISKEAFGLGYQNPDYLTAIDRSNEILGGDGVHIYKAYCDLNMIDEENYHPIQCLKENPQLFTREMVEQVLNNMKKSELKPFIKGTCDYNIVEEVLDNIRNKRNTSARRYLKPITTKELLYAISKFLDVRYK